MRHKDNKLLIKQNFLFFLLQNLLFLYKYFCMDLNELIDERDEMCLRISQLIAELHEKYDNLKFDISIDLKYDEYHDGSIVLSNTIVKSNIII